MSVKAFFDTNILLYLLDAADERGQTAGSLMTTHSGFISVQVLNEFVSVARRKLKCDWPQISRALRLFDDIFSEVSPLNLQTHSSALAIAQRYGYSIYDSLILASSLECDCSILYSEDMRHGQRVGPVTIKNPFAGE